MAALSNGTGPHDNKHNDNDVSDNDNDNDVNTDNDNTNNNIPNLIPNSIQIASDLHLEFPRVLETMTKIIPQSAVLALCGDICWTNKSDYITFLQDMSSKFKYVILIAGNHEYYYQEYHEVNNQIELMCKTEFPLKNVYFLQQSTLELDDVLPGIRIIGCTLWVDYPTKTHKSYKKVVNDFQRIYFDQHYNSLKTNIKNNIRSSIHIQKKNVRVSIPDDDDDYNDDKSDDTDNDNEYPFISPSDITNLYKSDVSFLKNEIKKCKIDKKKCIILTHHAPTDFACNPLNIAKAPVSYSTNYSNLESLFDSPIISWCWGHTHYNCDFVIKCLNNWFIRCATNQMGYIYKHLAKYYLSSKVIVFHDNNYWIDGDYLKEKEYITQFSDENKSRNTFINKKNNNQINLQITMIEYKDLLKNINIKKKYLPKDPKDDDDDACLLQ